MNKLYQYIVWECLFIFCENAYQEQKCADAGGICRNVNQPCLGTYKRNYCPKQPKEIRCCIPDGKNVSSVFRESDCTDAQGVCQNVSQTCHGKQLAGRCPSHDDSVTCCVNKTISLMDHINCSNTDKVEQTFELVLFNEGLCQIFAEDGKKLFFQLCCNILVI